MTSLKKCCRVTIEADYDRYVNDDNTTTTKLEKTVNIKYIQLLEDVLHRLELMDKVSNT